jgi:hypothetical protein
MLAPYHRSEAVNSGDIFTLFHTLNPALNATGVSSVEERRDSSGFSFSVYHIGYSLCSRSLKSRSLVYALKESILYEEPAGLLTMAVILRMSDVNDLVKDLV